MSWISDNRYLTEDEMRNNAQIIKDYLINECGWSLNAVCGVLGNMEIESTINPGIWQSLQVGTGGFGLVQWTPHTNYTDWADANGYDWTDGYGQLVWINEQTVPTGQWIATTDYNLTFNEFKVSNNSPEYLASAFLKNFERAGVEVEADRQSNARAWFDLFTGTDTPGDNTYIKKRKGYNFMLFCRRKRVRTWH